MFAKSQKLKANNSTEGARTISNRPGISLNELQLEDKEGVEEQRRTESGWVGDGGRRRIERVEQHKRCVRQRRLQTLG